MIATEAENILIKNNINHFIYNVGEPHLAECLVLRQRGNEWVIYNWERGREHSIEWFASEDAAARAFIEQVVQIASISAGRQIELK